MRPPCPPLLKPQLPSTPEGPAGSVLPTAPSAVSRTGHSLVYQVHSLPSHWGWHLCRFCSLPSPRGLKQSLAPRRCLVNICRRNAQAPGCTPSIWAPAGCPVRYGEDVWTCGGEGKPGQQGCRVDETTIHLYSEPWMEEDLKVRVVRKVQGSTTGARFKWGCGDVQVHSEIWERPENKPQFCRIGRI